MSTNEITLRDVLMDIVTHTHGLGFLPVVKVTTGEDCTKIESISDDKNVVLSAKTHSIVSQFDGIFGMPNLDKLSLHLRNPEYNNKDASISVVRVNKDGVSIPDHLHFENGYGDFKNNYRFMNAEIINNKLKSVTMRVQRWSVEFEPTETSITRFELQSLAHAENNVFRVKTEDDNLIVYFGSEASHAGSYVFQPDAGTIKHELAWPVSNVKSILKLHGDKFIKISDFGAMQINVDSGIALYEYVLPALTK
jgi:hypothetical protein